MTRSVYDSVEVSPAFAVMFSHVCPPFVDFQTPVFPGSPFGFKYRLGSVGLLATATYTVSWSWSPPGSGTTTTLEIEWRANWSSPRRTQDAPPSVDLRRPRPGKESVEKSASPMPA